MTRGGDKRSSLVTMEIDSSGSCSLWTGGTRGKGLGGGGFDGLRDYKRGSEKGWALRYSRVWIGLSGGSRFKYGRMGLDMGGCYKARGSRKRD